MKNLIILLSLSLTACTQFPQVEATRPVSFIQTSNKQAVLDKITEVCDRNGLQIDESTASSVTCSQLSSLGTQILLGTKYGTDVRTRTQFTLVPMAKGKIKISPRSWAENETAFGQTKKTEMNTSAVWQSTQQILNQVRAEIERKRGPK